MIWQPASNATELRIAGNGSTTTISGVIYAPTANPITLGTGNGTSSTAYVIGKYISVTGNGGAVVGS